MPQARDEAGNIWETDAQGNAVRLLQPAGQTRGQVFSLPPDENTAADNARADAQLALSQRGDARDNLRTGIAARGEQRDIGKQAFDEAAKLRGEYQGLPQVKEYQTVIRSYASALNTRPTPTGDQALITAYAKMLDPGSVVREQEFNTVASGDSSLGRAAARLGKELGLDDAGLLRADVRERVRGEMLNLTKKYNASYRQARQDYTRRSEQYGIKPEMVIGSHLGDPYLRDIERALERRGDDSALITPENKLASGDDTRKSIPIPPEMQAEYAQFVGKGGALDPQAYAQFRRSLNEKYGFGTGDAGAYAREAEGLNKARASGRNFVPQIPPADAEMTGRDQFNASVFNSAPGAFLMGAGSLGGGADEVFGTAKALVTGGDIGTNIAQMDATRQAAGNAYPGATVAGNLAGAGITAAGGLAALPATAGLGAVTGIGAGLGAVSGALDNNENRLAGAALGAGIGAAGGALGAKVVAPLAERIGRTAPFQQASRLLAESRGRAFTPAPRLTALDNAAMASKPDLVQIARNLRDAGDLNLPYSLADAAPELRTLAGTVSRKSPEARALAERTFEPRARGQADRAISAIDDNLAPITDVARRGRDLLEAGNIASRPYYDMAGQVTNPTRPGMEMFYSQPANPDRELTALLNTPTGKQALDRARRILSDRGGSPRSVGLATDENGNTVLQDGYSFEALDLVKKGMDDILQDYADPFTGKLNLSGKPQAQAIEGLRRRYVDRLDAINPTYKEARQAYQPYAQRKEALDTGFNSLPKSNVPERDFRRALEVLKPETLPEAQRGFATSLADQVDKVRLSANPYNAIYGSPLQQQKVEALFPEGAARFRRNYDLEDDMGKTRYETLGGSATAGRMAADDALGGQLGTMMVDAGSQALSGGGLSMGTALQAARRVLADSAKLGIGKQARERATQIAPQLFDTTNPNAIADLVDAMSERLGAVTARRADYGRRYGMFGATALPAVVPSGY